MPPVVIPPVVTPPIVLPPIIVPPIVIPPIIEPPIVIPPLGDHGSCNYTNLTNEEICSDISEINCILHGRVNSQIEDLTAIVQSN